MKLGRLIRVKNTERIPFSNANEEYYAVWVKKEEKQIPLLITDHELSRMKHRSSQNPEDIPELRQYTLWEKIKNLLKWK